MSADYADCVFINVPFDDEYEPLRDAIVFATFDCGFVPRCALEEDDSGNVRVEKIIQLIRESKFGIHDISRTELDSVNGLPRFNMPLELGLFLGAKKFGDSSQRSKNTIILDRERYRYQKFLSDLSGQDIRSHDGDAHKAITIVRNWLNSASGRKTIPGGAEIARRYERFLGDLPDICTAARLEPSEVTYNDLCQFASRWLQEAG